MLTVPNIDQTKLLDLADSQWLSLNELVSALKEPLAESSGSIKRVLAAYQLESVRPVRFSFTDGSGHRLRDMKSTPKNNTLNSILSYQLESKKEQEHAPYCLQHLCDGAVVEFTIPALYSWLIQCQLDEVADSVFGQWMHDSYPKLKMHNLLVTSSSDAKHTALTSQASTDATSIILNQDELIDLTGKKRGFAQHGVLQSMRVPSKIRADGVVIVFRHDLRTATGKKIKAKVQPNFDALG